VQRAVTDGAGVRARVALTRRLKIASRQRVLILDQLQPLSDIVWSSIRREGFTCVEKYVASKWKRSTTSYNHFQGTHLNDKAILGLFQDFSALKYQKIMTCCIIIYGLLACF